MVEQTSATHGRSKEPKAQDIEALDLDHPSLVRYSPNDHNYYIVRTYLKMCVQHIQSRVRGRSEQRQGTLSSFWSDDVLELCSTEPRVDVTNSQYREP